MTPGEGAVRLQVGHFDQAWQSEYHTETTEGSRVTNDGADVGHEHGEKYARSADGSVDHDDVHQGLREPNQDQQLHSDQVHQQGKDCDQLE